MSNETALPQSLSMPLSMDILSAYRNLFEIAKEHIPKDEFRISVKEFEDIQDKISAEVLEREEFIHLIEEADGQHGRDGEIEIDDSAVVSMSHDNGKDSKPTGAYVGAWLYVSIDEED